MGWTCCVHRFVCTGMDRRRADRAPSQMCRPGAACAEWRPTAEPWAGARRELAPVTACSQRVGGLGQHCGAHVRAGLPVGWWCPMPWLLRLVGACVPTPDASIPHVPAAPRFNISTQSFHQSPAELMQDMLTAVQLAAMVGAQQSVSTALKRGGANADHRVVAAAAAAAASRMAPMMLELVQARRNSPATPVPEVKISIPGVTPQGTCAVVCGVWWCVVWVSVAVCLCLCCGVVCLCGVRGWAWGVRSALVCVRAVGRYTRCCCIAVHTSRSCVCVCARGCYVASSASWRRHQYSGQEGGERGTAPAAATSAQPQRFHEGSPAAQAQGQLHGEGVCPCSVRCRPVMSACRP